MQVQVGSFQGTLLRTPQCFMSMDKFVPSRVRSLLVLGIFLSLHFKRDDRISGMLAPFALESDKVTASVFPNHAITGRCRGLVDWNRAPCGFSTVSVGFLLNCSGYLLTSDLHLHHIANLLAETSCGGSRGVQRSWPRCWV